MLRLVSCALVERSRASISRFKFCPSVLPGQAISSESAPAGCVHEQDGGHSPVIDAVTSSAVQNCNALASFSATIVGLLKRTIVGLFSRCLHEHLALRVLRVFTINALCFLWLLQLKRYILIVLLFSCLISLKLLKENISREYIHNIA